MHPCISSCLCVNTLRTKQNGRHISDDIFKCIFLNENDYISVKISLKSVPWINDFISHFIMNAITYPLLMHWSYVFLALTHRYHYVNTTMLETKAGPSVRDRQLLVRPATFYTFLYKFMFEFLKILIGTGNFFSLALNTETQWVIVGSGNGLSHVLSRTIT